MTFPSFPAVPLATLCLLCSLAVPAFALAQFDPSGSFVGGAIGWLRAGELTGGAINEALQEQGLAVRTTGADVNDTGWKLFAGYRFDRHWAVEGGYTFLGRYAFEGQVIADPGTVQAGFERVPGTHSRSACSRWESGSRFSGRPALGSGERDSRRRVLSAGEAHSRSLPAASGLSPAWAHGFDSRTDSAHASSSSASSMSAMPRAPDAPISTSGRSAWSTDFD